MAFEYESKSPQDVLVYTDSPIFHKRTVILDLAADVVCGDVINPTTGAAYAMNVGAVGIVGSFLGLPLEAMILGTIAGAVVHGLNRAVTRPNGIATIITSALLAGAFSPAISAWVALQLEIGDTPDAEIMLLKPLVPVLIGAAWPWILPMLNEGIKNLWAGWINKLGGRHE